MGWSLRKVEGLKIESDFDALILDESWKDILLISNQMNNDKEIQEWSMGKEKNEMEQMLEYYHVESIQELVTIMQSQNKS